MPLPSNEVKSVTLWNSRIVRDFPPTPKYCIDFRVELEKIVQIAGMKLH